MQEMDLFLKRGNRKGQSIYKKKVELNTDFIAKDSYILANFSKSSLAKEYHMQLFGRIYKGIILGIMIELSMYIIWFINSM